METRFRKSIAKENYKPAVPHVEPVPDITDFMMNDWFYGTSSPVKKADNNRHKGYRKEEAEKEKEKEKKEERGHVIAGRKRCSSTSRLTQDWLEEAKKMVAESPSRHALPAMHAGSPRFTSPQLVREPSPLIERRDPLSRSARRQRSAESISNEILLKSTALHSRSNSLSSNPLSPTSTTAEKSPASAVHQWFSKILNPNNPQPEPINPNPLTHQPQCSPPQFPSLPLKLQKPLRKSRFQQIDPSTPPLPLPPKRTFRDASPSRQIKIQDSPLSPPPVLSPPRNLVQSVHRRSISSSTCSVDPAGPTLLPRLTSVGLSADLLAVSVDEDVREVNEFLKRQRAKIERVVRGEVRVKAKIVLSGSSTSSIVGAIGYTWLVENREKKGEEEGEEVVVVPVVNTRRGRMWKHRQAAWLFHHLGIDASLMLFRDEVDLEGLVMARQLTMLVVGQDVLKTNGEVGSECTVLTDNYCEDAYGLLQSPNLKKFLLAGILLDTQNLNSAAKLCTNRDVEAVQLLLVGASPNYRHDLYDQLMRDHKSNLFLEAMISNYGRPYSEGKEENGVFQEARISTRKSTSVSPKKAKIPSLKKNENRVPQEPRLSTRKSTSISPKESKMTSAKERTSPAPVVSPVKGPKPAPVVALVKAQEKPKNSNFFTKLFGLGSK